MCTTKTPKVQQPTQKQPVYMSNPYLDGLGIAAESSGRNSLRIDPGTPASRPGTTALPPGYPGGFGGLGGLGIGNGNYGGSNYGPGLGIGIGTPRVMVR